MKGLGVKVIISDRKAALTVTEDGPSYVRDDVETPTRTSFSTVLKHCTTLILTCPLTPETRNLISGAELAVMRPEAVIVNVARGGVVFETDMATALNAGSIAGYATDVFSKEPAGPGDIPVMSDLKADAHFIASPHVAWFSETTLVNLSQTLSDNVELWLAGTPQNVIV
jgi:lactate dehydrogenase-like 2-hydroxyacid dehydrogenase